MGHLRLSAVTKSFGKALKVRHNDPDDLEKKLSRVPENKGKLVDILKYHVVSGRVYSDQLANGEVPTLGGEHLTVDLEHGVRIDKANVKAADIDTTNGVIHVIDSVILPPAGDQASISKQADIAAR